MIQNEAILANKIAMMQNDTILSNCIEFFSILFQFIFFFNYIAVNYFGFGEHSHMTSDVFGVFLTYLPRAGRGLVPLNQKLSWY